MKNIIPAGSQQQTYFTFGKREEHTDVEDDDTPEDLTDGPGDGGGGIG